MKYLIIIISGFLLSSMSGCGFQNLIFKREDIINKYAVNRDAKNAELDRKIAPYIGKDKKHIVSLFGEAKKINKYDSPRAKNNADEVWYYWMKDSVKEWVVTFFFRDSKLITVDVI
ncbi:MAG: hypothetical protein KAX15_05515 [Candidatus Omnitrophica bacterium]|nr:hypothetical protein [Candidatus Omnitrophota bacterium]